MVFNLPEDLFGFNVRQSGYNVYTICTTPTVLQGIVTNSEFLWYLDFETAFTRNCQRTEIRFQKRSDLSVIDRSSSKNLNGEVCFPKLIFSLTKWSIDLLRRYGFLVFDPNRFRCTEILAIKPPN